MRWSRKGHPSCAIIITVPSIYVENNLDVDKAYNNMEYNHNK